MEGDRAEVKPLKKIYNQICGFLSMRNISWMVLALFLLLLIPICYLSFVNRATGDDYGYGTDTRAAWMATGSLIEVMKAIGTTIKQYYDGWQGTWFSIAVFALQPEVFSDKGYVIVVFVMLFLWIGSTALLFREILCKEWGLSKWSYLLITLIYLIIGIQFVPSTKSSIFWFNGCAHYMLPFAMCQAVAWCLIRFVKEYRICYLAEITVLMTLLGGSNYQAALFALIVWFYVGIAGWLRHKNKRIFLLLLPFVLEMTGLIISMKAPGNKVRGGENFGFSVSKIAATIGLCFVEGIKAIIGYVQEKPMIFIGLAVLFLFMLEAFKSVEEGRKLKHPVIIILALICLYCAMQAPALYADVNVSGGVNNMNFMVFLLAAAGCLGVAANMISVKAKMSGETVHRNVVIPGLFICAVLLVLCRSNIKISTSWVSLEYIRSGQAADYKRQMDLQTEVLTDEKIMDAVLPFVNDYQGPLMSMPVTEDPSAWTNTVMRQFYGKNSVVGIPRDEWEEKYGGR